jgi:hypothetical protein
MLQMLFQEVTGNHLSLSLRRLMVSHCLFMFCGVSITVSMNIYDPYVPLWRMLSLLLLLFEGFLCFLFRDTLYHAVLLTSDSLAGRFKVKASRTIKLEMTLTMVHGVQD